MAKKQRQWFDIIDNYLELAYKSGILHSFIFNVSLLLILALIVPSLTKIQSPIVIDLAYSLVEVPDDTITDISTINFESEDTNSDTNEEAYVESESQDIQIENPELTDKIVDTISEISLTDISEQIQTVSRSTNTTSDEDDGESSVPGDGDKDFQKRLKDAGAQTGDIQISIAWDNLNDIDVWVVVENKFGQFSINWMNRIGPNNGMLDIDMNVLPVSRNAVENIFWPHGSAPEGKYTVYINHYKQWDKKNTTSIRVRILENGKIITKKLTISSKDGLKKVFSFYHKRNQSEDSIVPHFPIGQLWSRQ